MSIIIAKPSLDLPGVDQVSADSLIDWKNNWLPSTRCVIGLESWDHIKNYKLYILWFIHSMSCRAARGTQCNHDHINVQPEINQMQACLYFGKSYGVLRLINLLLFQLDFN